MSLKLVIEYSIETCSDCPYFETVFGRDPTTMSRPRLGFACDKLRYHNYEHNPYTAIAPNCPLHDGERNKNDIPFWKHEDNKRKGKEWDLRSRDYKKGPKTTDKAIISVGMYCVKCRRNYRFSVEDYNKSISGLLPDSTLTCSKCNARLRPVSYKNKGRTKTELKALENKEKKRDGT